MYICMYIYIYNDKAAGAPLGAPHLCISALYMHVYMHVYIYIQRQGRGGTARRSAPVYLGIIYACIYACIYIYTTTRPRGHRSALRTCVSRHYICMYICMYIYIYNDKAAGAPLGA